MKKRSKKVSTLCDAHGVLLKCGDKVRHRVQSNVHNDGIVFEFVWLNGISAIRGHVKKLYVLVWSYTNSVHAYVGTEIEKIGEYSREEMLTHHEERVRMSVV